ncbi:histone-binding protein RBBP7 [Sphaeroforma arctica JP610]|uniref:Histone-binding protein RBBP7 n=1 Tax=Sphaeroforma arctica JP610 TaxID=667725 RepID=A0A0L0G391_9EUKA|nr:histone-binding protein RBBP7 [Sphaeroforma arctica JP610]KNC83545.1 histone-binding protein RBBP7 [Sphaeroforma arctica JP610]|eukprot:XP_014157447.1 histone-binding protein RBBP7 [Sphaeroforma arctica JP610]
MNRSFEHNGEINRARCMPQNPNIVATKGPAPELFLYDIGVEGDSKREQPVLKLTGHEKEGYGLAWNPNNQGVLLSGSDDGVVCVWDVENSTSLTGPSHTQDARRKFTAHTDIVEDVAWHCTSRNVFGSVSDDKTLMLWDDREDGAAPVISATVHTAEVTCLAFNPFNEFIVATGSVDKTAAIWDIRNLKKSLHTLSHIDEVVQVAWSPRHETILASSGSDRRLMVWDLSLIGAEQSAADAAEGPPELLFVHSGHTAKISDFDWSPDEERTICTVSEDNVLQCWTMGAHVYSDYEPGISEADPPVES